MSERRLLLVDDEDDIRTIATMSLERIGGWTVVPAASGAEALEAARAHDGFAAVLLDVTMPDVDGPTTLERLRPIIGEAVPVVFLTAKIGPSDRERLQQAGAAGVIAKPFDPMSLPDELARLIAA